MPALTARVYGPLGARARPRHHFFEIARRFKYMTEEQIEEERAVLQHGIPAEAVEHVKKFQDSTPLQPSVISGSTHAVFLGTHLTLVIAFLGCARMRRRLKSAR